MHSVISLYSRFYFYESSLMSLHAGDLMYGSFSTGSTRLVVSATNAV